MQPSPPLPPPSLATATTTDITLATAKKVKGDVWVTGQWLVAAGEDSWLRWISSSLLECCFFLKADFFVCHKKIGSVQKIV
jgi:hypothetical protein